MNWNWNYKDTGTTLVRMFVCMSACRNVHVHACVYHSATNSSILIISYIAELLHGPVTDLLWENTLQFSVTEHEGVYACMYNICVNIHAACIHIIAMYICICIYMYTCMHTYVLACAWTNILNWNEPLKVPSFEWWM